MLAALAKRRVALPAVGVDRVLSPMVLVILVHSTGRAVQL